MRSTMDMSVLPTRGHELDSRDTVPADVRNGYVDLPGNIAVARKPPPRHITAEPPNSNEQDGPQPGRQSLSSSTQGAVFPK